MANAYAQSTQVFRVGWITGGDPLLTARLEPFIAHLQEALDRPVELFPARDGTMLIDAIASDQIDYAPLSGAAYALGQSLCDCLIPLASPSTEDGQTHFRSVLLAKPDTDRPKQTQVLAGPAADFLTYQVPNFALMSGALDGVANDIVLDVSPSLEFVFDLAVAGDTRPALAWTYTQPDTEISDNGDLSGFAAVLVDEVPALELVWQSEAFRIAAHSVHRSIPETERQKLTQALVDIKEKAPLAFDVISPTLGGGFQPAQIGDYANYIGVLNALPKDQ
ncbi:MAG: PhnD/SsuA/transferrin family substrate-binding protein [Pseudomonadota bacterium]